MSKISILSRQIDSSNTEQPLCCPQLHPKGTVGTMLSAAPSLPLSPAVLQGAFGLAAAARHGCDDTMQVRRQET